MNMIIQSNFPYRIVYSPIICYTSKKKGSDNVTHILESDLLYVEINPLGAELSRLYSKRTGREYLWQGDPNIWERQAPVLFPIVGRLKDDTYTYNGKDYTLPCHGFAPDVIFETKGPRDDTIIFTYSDNKETRAVYPFAFKMQVIFTIRWSQVDITYHITNKTNGPMYFSCGSHEGYNCPWLEDEAFEDYFLEFDHEATYESCTVSPDGLLMEPFYTVVENGRVLPLDHRIFENGTSLVFINIPTGKVSLGSHKSKERVIISYGDAPNLVVWSMPDAPYICIEPWWGLPDFEDSDGQFISKPAIINLEKGEVFNWKHTVNIYE